ncbi:epoxide hydrolase family protein [Paenibacillus gansuensis]|uniref:Epoxide hydrolase family protein n=1 Tax=Paenibacillus gansuensis TaxID=306542 RepID=A0ABW5PK16_9BACL
MNSRCWFRLPQIMTIILFASLVLPACGVNNNSERARISEVGRNNQIIKNQSANNPHQSQSFRLESVIREQPTNNADIRQIQVHFPDSALANLRNKILATEWPEKETVSDQSQGVPLETTQRLAKYWATNYDWRKVEAKLNSLPQYLINIDGVDIHFIHVQSKHKNALPILITHGWPGSIIEQLKIIDPLTNPTAYGGKASDAFDVVIPSMPGYGFSGKPTTVGWGPEHIAKVWSKLMKRLGYTKYVAQGGDWGAVITDLMAVQKSPGLVGIHTNMPGVFPPEIDKAVQSAAFIRSPLPSGLSAEEKRAVKQLEFFYKHSGYAYLMGTRPQTQTGLVDSPVALATYMIDHDAKSLDLISRVFAGQPEGLSPDDVLDNITLFWLTKTAISAARLYWERQEKNISFFAAKGVKIPAGVSVFPDEMYEAPKSWSKKAYPKLIHYNKLPKGGHFAAWEQPKYLVDEIRATFRTLR